MTGQQLRNSILQEAIQGRLVPQYFEEGPASILVESIRQEKNRRIRDGRLKKEKVPLIISEDDIPFDIPSSWEWVRVQDIFNVRSALRIHQTDWRNEGVPFFRGRELVQLANTGKTNPEVFISRELYETNKAKGGVPQKNDLLVSAVGTIGKVYIVQGTKEFYYKDAYILCFENYADIYVKYIKYALESPYLQQEIHRDSMATTVAQLTIIKAKSLLIPLPPVGEQKRIVEKIEELFPLVDEYEKADIELNTLNERLPDKLRKSVLQEAIHGNLVSNDIPDGEARAPELLKQILKERQEKEKREKGEKAKKLTLSTIDEEPWELPDGWCWCRIGEIADIERGGNFVKSDFVERGYPCIHYGQIHMRFGPRTYSVLSYLPNEHAAKQRKAHRGDIIMAVTSENIEDVCKCTAWLGDDDVAIGAHTAIIRHYIDPVFLVYYFKSSLFYSQKKDLGHGSKVVEVTPVSLNNVILPLPPLSIQHRIVEKIEEVFSAIDKLQA